jgi:hypothetical protein
MSKRLQSIQNILSDLGQGFKEDYAIGKEDTTRMYYRKRELDNKSDDAPKVENMLGTHPGMFRLRELMGKTTPAEQEALKEANMELRGSTAHKVGQFLGTAAADITQDRSRSIYWLLNALQATGEVINESALAKAVPSLYETSPVMSGKSVMTQQGKVPKAYQPGNKEDLATMLKQGMVRRDDEDRIVPARGYKFKTNDEGEKELHKRNYSQGMLAATAIPTGIAINSGLGLLSPFGGAEGYKAAIPSDEDPTKTENVIGEVALKYVMGRTGNLLPYEEFKKVRPDVSRKEYAEYQRFKYDKREDYNPLDGDITVAAGALKATNDGIHGPEVQFLGRSLPVTTGVVPYAAALAGGVAGARYGAKNQKAALGALTGGMAGLVSGQVGGNIIEQERRRRNSVENELESGNAEMYLR